MKRELSDFVKGYTVMNNTLDLYIEAREKGAVTPEDVPEIQEQFEEHNWMFNYIIEMGTKSHATGLVCGFLCHPIKYYQGAFHYKRLEDAA